MADIKLRDVHKRYGHVQVINNVNLEIADGEFCVFVGPSGCGKSTLLRMVAGLEEISAGTLHIGGRDVTHLPPSERGVAMVFQSYALYPHMTIFENMAFGLKLAKTDKSDIDKRVRKAADILHLGHLLERLPKELSGGQRQRVAIGRAIVREPGVFLFDEPLSNLDAALRVQTRIEIAKLHASLSASMIYVTHDQVEAMTMADKIVLLNAGEAMSRDGSIAQVGEPLELYHHPTNLFVAGFIGSPKMNFLPATISAITGERVEVTLASGARASATVDAGSARVGDKVTLGVRPEHTLIGGSTDAMGVITGGARHVEHLGESSYLYVESPATANDEATLTVREEGDTAIHVGEPLTVTLPEAHCHLFDANGHAYRRRLKPGAQVRPPLMAVPNTSH
ncbi:carbohydrate ABC transporter ATP-binding protein (CUT1 family) [Plasticicumulans lactativorans]|uniref:Carbohydrate ABC transporter ATP-binding protein (CUT1 family) n=1 Tax=Plasticicumulans lactativorans TaxID=1133106 RepID=A0A4R2KXD7_9GAMM|nr:sn-glycerol-3-phosphate ABC transporter ATP-binding protein UgpC [Plasticicumulans lactativorans]TCO75989.1 carbohydrate ABC transporter ATP-binding protein (CUT1 family) [Plasticicumulans lactativorans]